MFDDLVFENFAIYSFRFLNLKIDFFIFEIHFEIIINFKKKVFLKF